MRKTFVGSIIISLGLLTTPQFSLAQDNSNWRHGSSLVGDLKYEKDFPHFDYVNPNAPKGGSLRLSADDTFDTLNPLLSKGSVVLGLELTLETLMKASEDEISSQYGLVAEAFTYPEDYSYVTFRLRDNARWHDGVPITPEDVIFSYERAIELSPQRKNYYKHVQSVEKIGDREVKFTFDEIDNRELPTIVGQLSILPKHWWEGTDKDGNSRNIGSTTLEPILGSGPYQISKISPGSSIEYLRVKDYWGDQVNVNVGKNNFDSIKYSYFSDTNVEFEAFKADEFDYWLENEAKRWSTGYDFPAFNEGKVKRELLANPYRSSGILVGFLPNARRDKFKDARVRRALNLAYDFEEQNRTLFYDSYQRIDSYFFGSELASSGLPQGDELALLEELRGQIPDRVFTEEYKNPVGGTPQKVRTNLREAINLFNQAGYETRGGKMVDSKTGEPFTFEILLNGPTIEKVALPYAQALKKIGVEVSVRTVDRSQYVNRWRARDYDVIYLGWAQSLSPGNEQLGYWGSGSVDQEGSANYVGISDPAIDKLIDKVIFAKTREDLITATKALDRVLLASDYVVPTYTLRAERIAYWDRFGRPDELPTYSVGFPDVWWSKTAQ
jgi:microcin C transport system substrate-binding protein